MRHLVYVLQMMHVPLAREPPLIKYHISEKTSRTTTKLYVYHTLIIPFKQIAYKLK